jgi:hypothetical protein
MALNNRILSFFPGCAYYLASCSAASALFEIAPAVHLHDAKYVSTLFVLDTPCERAKALGSRQAAVCSLPHGSLTPAVVLTEPPNTVKCSRREYHYCSDCHRHTGSNPVLVEGVLARPDLAGVLAYPATLAHAFAHRKRMYLTNGYSVVKVAKGRLSLSPPYWLKDFRLLHKKLKKFLQPSQ